MAKGHTHRPQVRILRRGDIYLVNFDPTIGHEIKKTRPALVIQNDTGNRYSPLTIVAAITSSISHVSFPVKVVVQPSAVNGLDVVSAVRLDQIRTIGRQRLLKRIGSADRLTMQRVDDALAISVGLI